MQKVQDNNYLKIILSIYKDAVSMDSKIILHLSLTLLYAIAVLVYLRLE